MEPYNNVKVNTIYIIISLGYFCFIITNDMLIHITGMYTHMSDKWF